MTQDEAKDLIEKTAETIIESLAHLPPPIVAVALIGVLAAQATLAGFKRENVIAAFNSAWDDINKEEKPGSRFVQGSPGSPAYNREGIRNNDQDAAC